MFDEDALRQLVGECVLAALRTYGLASPPPRPTSVTVAGAAELTGMSTWRIRQLVKAGRLPLLDLDGGQEWIIPTKALEELPTRYLADVDEGESPPVRSPTAA